MINFSERARNNIFGLFCQLWPNLNFSEKSTLTNFFKFWVDVIVHLFLKKTKRRESFPQFCLIQCDSVYKQECTLVRHDIINYIRFARGDDFTPKLNGDFSVVINYCRNIS